ncbi:monooxygenase [Mycolicibacterium conceptionense]|uniref:Monooxygenase n=1 Tax=Mycolicibacterium conceptionense TaxID=451644 RepID=A0A0U1DYS2_9MYCO|nr:monooxygenase [Mycolicibacterium conceptionense]
MVPRYGILAKRPVISSAFLPALNNPGTHLITTPIERITATGVRTTDGVEHPCDLLVLATGYELWIDPETYRPDTVLGARGFDLARYYRAHGLHSYAGTAHPRLPNRWEIVGPLGFVGFAWLDYVETMAAHAVRMIDETRRRGAQVAAVTQDAFNRWNARMRRDGRVAHLYYTATSGLNTYFVNSQHETPYYRPQTITGSRQFARHSPLSDYEFTNVRVPALPEEQPA